MKVPLLRAVALGEFSPWAQQAISSFEENEILEITLEPSVENFCQSLVPQTKPLTVFLENQPKSRENMLQIFSTGIPIYLIWIGKNFTKEDLSFALERRVYSIFEAAQLDQEKWIQNLRALAQRVDNADQQNQLLRAMKSILLQTEADFPDIPMVTELRHAVKKLDNLKLENELAYHAAPDQSEGKEAILSKSQTFGEAIVTISELERTGVLWIRGSLPEQEGRIEFFQGKMIEAASSGSHGVKAILRMFLWDKHRFIFNRRDTSEASSIQSLEIDVNQLAKMGTIAKEKYERIRQETPSLSLRLEINPGAVNKDTAIVSNDFSTLSSVIEVGRVDMVLDSNPLPDIEIYESLINLRRNNLIRRASS
jgi:Domain of unknown function (DUF4388)